MPSGGMHASSHPLRWPLRPHTTAALAASGLLLLLFTVSRRIWRGGGRKTQDSGGTGSSKKVKEKKCQVQECSGDLDNFLVTSNKKEILSDCSNNETLEVQGSPVQLVGVEEPFLKEADVEEKVIKQCIEEISAPEEQIEAEILSPAKESLLTTIVGSGKELCKHSESASVELGEVLSLDVKLKKVPVDKSDLLDCPAELEAPKAVEEKKDIVSEETVAVSIISEVCGSVLRQEVLSPVIAEIGDTVEEENKGVVSEAEVSVCLEDIKTKGQPNILEKEKVESTNILPLTSEVVKEEKKDLQGTAKSEVPKVTSAKRSISVSKEEEGIVQEVVSEQAVKEEVMQVNQAKPDLEEQTKSSAKPLGKRKVVKGNKNIQKVESKGVKSEMEVKDMMRDSVENEGVGEVEEHMSKCEVSTNQVSLDSSGLGSPSMSNFPDNRSEGSSCGDSGKGRSDVTTPGGLEEEEREVSFPRHFSPPCSTSGPEEEEEENGNDTVEDGNLEEKSGEAVLLGDPVGLLVDGSMEPMGIPMAMYPGIVPMAPPPSVYEFVIPQGLVGRLIGKHGSFVNLIKARTSASIFIKTHPETSKLKVCAIEGTDSEIQTALDMIREKFPQRRYSSMTLEQVFFLPLPPPSFTLIPESLHLHLVEGVSNDVILSAMVSPNHYFLQQPTHPTYPTLAKLDMWMSVCYQDANAPMLPESVEAGIICAAPTMGGWYRAQIVAVEEQSSATEEDSTEEGELVKWCDIRFVDYGGYERLPAHSLRQIRSDFMTLPFQASECYLASVVPAPSSDENKTADGWSMEAYSLVEELTQSQVIQAQVVGHAHDGLPLVFLFAYSHSFGQIVQVNNELVRRGLAVWAVPVVDVDQLIGESASEEDQQTEEEVSEVKAA